MFRVLLFKPSPVPGARTPARWKTAYSASVKAMKIVEVGILVLGVRLEDVHLAVVIVVLSLLERTEERDVKVRVMPVPPEARVVVEVDEASLVVQNTGAIALSQIGKESAA